MEFFGFNLEKEEGDEAGPDRDALLAVFAIMRPKPPPVKLIRIGGDGDGAYLLPDDFDGVAACFSPGVSGRKNFEDALADDYGIRSHMCDFSTDVAKLKTPMKPGM